MRRRAPRATGKALARRAPAPAPERLHKVLARHGLGSTRQVEGWIKEGRVLVNGRPATAGQAITSRDRVLVDGRDVSRLLQQGPDLRVIVYHKPGGEMLRRRSGDERDAVEEHLPTLRGARWLPVNALGFGEDGLLVLSNDGTFAARVGRLGRELPVEYRVRALRPRAEADWPQFPLEVRTDSATARFSAVEQVGGSTTNQWFRVTAERGLPRGAITALFDSCGLKLSRTMLVRWGPLQLPRDLPRGRSRDLDTSELTALRALTDSRSDDR